MIQFDKDKQLHALAGFVIGLSSFVFASLYVFTAGVLLAVGKEVYDYFHPAIHSCDVSDALVTIGALSLGLYIHAIVYYNIATTLVR
jgi:hypothetical protein